MALTGCPLCDFQVKIEGKQATAEEDFIRQDYKLNITEKQSTKGEVVVNTGSIPDRVVVYEDGKKIGDTGYYADEASQYDGVSYVPLYVKELSSRYDKYKKMDAFDNVELKTKEEEIEIGIDAFLLLTTSHSMKNI